MKLKQVSLAVVVCVATWVVLTLTPSTHLSIRSASLYTETPAPQDNPPEARVRRRMFIPLIARNYNLGFFVSPSGYNNNNGSFDKPWRDIHYGIAQLQAGDVLNIMPGDYQLGAGPPVFEYAVTPRSGRADLPIVVRAFVRGTVIIDGAGTVARFLVLAHDYWVLDGFELQNFGTRTILIQGSHNVIRNMKIHGMRLNTDLYPNTETVIGINVGYDLSHTCDDNLIINNKIYDIPDGEAIYLGRAGSTLQCQHNQVLNNSLHDMWEGVDAKINATDNLIRGNVIYDCLNFGVGSPDGNIIEGNLFYNCGQRESGASIVIRRNSLVINNVFHDNPVRAIKLHGGTSPELLNQPMGYGNRVYNNTLVHNVVGIDFSTGELVRDNHILNNISAFNDVQIQNEPLGGGNWLDYNVWYGKDNRHALDGPHTSRDNPRFMDWRLLDFRPRPASPAVDAGLDLYDQGVVSDYLGASRPQGYFDIGAIEH